MTAITRGPVGDTTPSDAVPLLLRLYPAPWRERYGDEFVELLLSRPPSGRDLVDIVRGAIDARLHPQVADQQPLRSPSAGDRVLALVGATVGLLLTAWAGIIVVAEPRWGMGSNVDDTLIAASFSAGFVGGVLAIGVLIGLARRYANELGPIGTTGALIDAAAFLFILAEADAFGVALLPIGTLMLGPGLARIVPWPIAAALAAATVAMTLSMFGFVASEGQSVVWLSLLLAYGPAWVLLGICLRRGPRATPQILPGASTS